MSMETDKLHLLSAQQAVAMLKAGQLTPLQLIDVTEVRASNFTNIRDSAIAT